MQINSNKTITITEANQNFSQAIKKADECGEVIIYKRNKPQYALINLEESPQIYMTEKEKILFVGERILKKHIEAFKELAK